MDNSQTIANQKSAFIRSQVRLLSAILRPSSTWRNDPSTSLPSQDPSPANRDIPQKTIDTVLANLNDHLATHNRAAYPPQTQRHIAEQIDKVYWNDVSSEGLNAPLPGEVTIPKTIDLATEDGLDSLPDVYDELYLIPPASAHEHIESAAEAARYHALKSRLRTAVAEQKRQRARLEGYRRLAGLLAPFEDAAGDLQGNLAGRNGELERELGRLRVLVARVVGAIQGGGLEGVEEGSGLGNEKITGMNESEKIKALTQAL